MVPYWVLPYFNTKKKHEISKISVDMIQVSITKQRFTWGMIDLGHEV